MAGLVEKKDLDVIEDTFMPTRDVISFVKGYEHSIARLRPKVESKVQLKFLDAKTEDGGVTVGNITSTKLWIRSRILCMYEIFWTRNEEAHG